MSDVYTTAPVPTASQSYEIGRAHGVKAEQQRIIKLLEDYEWTEIFIPTLIALIKGGK